MIYNIIFIIALEIRLSKEVLGDTWLILLASKFELGT